MRRKIVIVAAYGAEGHLNWEAPKLRVGDA
jgi:hypothetical protein